MRNELAKLRFLCAAALLTLTLAACGGGGGSSTPPPPPPPPQVVAPPSALSYSAPPNYTLNTAITALNPTVTGTVTTYSVSPALPTGLAFDTTTGAISGTPTALQPATTYAITATNAGGFTTATFVVTVIDVAPSIGYPLASYTFTSERAISPLVPASTAGGVVTWSIDQPLPAGLNFSTSTGEIAGTATVTSPATTYRVTAVNSGGADFFDVAITVRSGILFDLGHVSLPSIKYTGTRVLTIESGRIRLFDSQTGATLVREEPQCPPTDCSPLPRLSDHAKIAGNVLVVYRHQGFKVFDLATGTQTAMIPVPNVTTTGEWDLATDGSYVVYRTAESMAAWTTAGVPIFYRTSGYHLGRRFFAAPGEYRLVADGSIGSQYVEYIAMPSGVSTRSGSLTGDFRHWFTDGNRFVMSAGNVGLVYSSAAVQQWTFALGLGAVSAGLGDWIWTTEGGVSNFYAVGGPATPAATIGLGAYWVTLTRDGYRLVSYDDLVVDLSGSTPTVTPVDFGGAQQLAYQSPTDWVTGNTSGVVIVNPMSAQPLQLTLGRVSWIAGSDTRFAMEIASGPILYFDAATLTQQGSLNFNASQVVLTRDGSALAASGRLYGDPTSAPNRLRLYSLPSETLVADWLAPASTPSISDDGNLIGHDIRVFRSDGSFMAFASGVDAPALVSPSGNRVTIKQTKPTAGVDWTTNIYVNGVLSAFTAGGAAGWIDENRMLVHRSRKARLSDFFPSYYISAVVDANGQDLSEIDFRYPGPFQRVGTNLIYMPRENSIFDVTTGAVVWNSPLGRGESAIGAVAGNYVIYVSDAFVRAELR